MVTKTVTPTREAIDTAMAYERERLKTRARDSRRCFVESLWRLQRLRQSRISLLQMKQGCSAIDQLTHTTTSTYKQSVTSSYHVETIFSNDGNDVTSEWIVNIPKIRITPGQIPRPSFPARDTGSDPRWGYLGLGPRLPSPPVNFLLQTTGVWVFGNEARVMICGQF